MRMLCVCQLVQAKQALLVAWKVIMELYIKLYIRGATKYVVCPMLSNSPVPAAPELPAALLGGGQGHLAESFVSE